MRIADLSSRRRSAIPITSNTAISSFRLGTSYASGTNYDKMFSLVVSVGDADSASAIPNVKALGYCSGVQVERNVFNRNIGAFVDISVARSNGWLLHKGTSELGYSLDVNGVPTTSLADPGNVSFQNEWATECLAFIRAHNLDGIHVDNFEIDLLNFNAKLADGSTFTYPTVEADGASQSAFADAQISFAANALAQVRAAGYYVVVNGNAFISGNNASNDGSLTKTWIARYAPYVDAMEIEYWIQSPGNPANMRSSGGTDPFPFWDEWLSVHPYCLSQGIGFHGLVYGDVGDVQRCRYGRASFLMDWDGVKGTFAWAPLVNADNWNSAMAYVTGAPTNTKQNLTTGVWKRTYQNYNVYVNSTLSPVTVDGQTIPAQDGLFVAAGVPTGGTWGSTATSGTDLSGYSANMEALALVTATATAVSKHTVWIKNTTGGAIHVKGVARNDGISQPGTLITSGTEVTVPAGNDGLVDLPISYTPGAGNLWIGLISDGNFLVKRTALTGGSVSYATDTYSDGPASSWGAQAAGNLGIDTFINTMYATHA